ncbi:MAG: DUF6788 family protein [Candidatus Helarchaeota archaeon]
MLSKTVLRDEDLINLLNKLNEKLDDLTQKRKNLMLQIKDSESGILIYEYVKCGKKGCRCNNGVSLHGPYYYHYFWSDGKLRKKYICPVNKINDNFKDLIEKIENNKKNKEIQKQIKIIENFILRINQMKDRFKDEIIEILNFL